MSNEVLPVVSNEVFEAFQEFDEDYLADVLRIWDCYEQDWHDCSPTLFRFENDDLLVWNELGGLRAIRGAVDTTSFDSALLGEGTEQESCLVWRADPSFTDLIGRAALSTVLLRSLA